MILLILEGQQSLIESTYVKWEIQNGNRTKCLKLNDRVFEQKV